MNGADRLARTITARPAGGCRLRAAVVAGTGPLTITLDGATVSAVHLTSYSPTVSDVVCVLVDGNHFLVLGIAGGGSGSV